MGLWGCRVVGQLTVGERRLGDAEVGVVRLLVLHDRFGEEIGEVERAMVEAGKLEVEQFDIAVLQLHDIAVIGVVVTECRRPLWQASHDLRQCCLAVNFPKLLAHPLLVRGEHGQLLVQDKPGFPPPFFMQEVSAQ